MEPAIHWIELLEHFDVPCGRVNSIKEALDNENTRKYVQELHHPVYGNVKIPGMFPVFMSFPGFINIPDVFMYFPGFINIPDVVNASPRVHEYVSPRVHKYASRRLVVKKWRKVLPTKLFYRRISFTEEYFLDIMRRAQSSAFIFSMIGAIKL